jgi:hypothetical protein
MLIQFSLNSGHLQRVSHNETTWLFSSHFWPLLKKETFLKEGREGIENGPET